VSSNTLCRLCRSSKLFHTLCTIQPKKEEGTVAFLSCTSCGFVFREPFPTRDTLEIYYQNLWEKVGKSISHEEKASATAHRFLKQLSKYSRPGRFLDVGCGPGLYLQAAHQEGWKTYGVDISPVFRKKEEGIEIFKGTLEEAHFPLGFFDACLMSHTLSHLLNPSETLSEIHRVLDSKGILIVVIPHWLRLGISGLESHWNRLIQEKHLYLFNRETAKRMIEASDFEVFRVETQAEFLTHDQLKRFRIPLEEGPARFVARFSIGPKGLLRKIVGKFFPGPVLVLWARKKTAA